MASSRFPRAPARHRAVMLIAAVSVTCVPTPPLAAPYRASLPKETPPACAPDAVTGAMVHVPAGRFEMGASFGDDDEGPVRLLAMPAFDVDKTEVTVRAYAACVEAGACEEPATEPYCNWPLAPARARHPVNCIAWHQAAAFCAWAGKRLPTEEEWEYAARGSEGFKYPWGKAPPRRQACWDGAASEGGQGARRGTCSVATHPMGQSPFGAEDMAGNVLEWTSNLYSSHYGGAEQPGVRVSRGGSWVTFEGGDLRTTLRMRAPALRRDFTIGFRCVR